jgi:hypothetical protein
VNICVLGVIYGASGWFCSYFGDNIVSIGIHMTDRTCFDESVWYENGIKVIERRD